jgi:tripartite-type tricarboxylate transporter receptor subunit TctC
MFRPGLVAAAIVFSCAAAPPARAQSYPSGPVRLVLTAPPGGSADMMGRVVAQKLSEIWKQTVTVENRAGAGGAIGMEYVMRQPGDGLAFVISNLGPIAVTPLLSPSHYVLERDFTPVSLVGVAPSVLVVNATSPYKTVADLVDAARAAPGKLNFGTGSPGSLSRTGVEILMREAKVRMTNVPYTGGIATINALLGDQIQLSIADIQPSIPQIKGGKLRPLAVTSATRSPQLPGVPSIAEAGFPGVVALNSWSAYLPASTPPAIVDQLNASLRKALADPDLAKKFDEYGMEPKASTPEELRTFIAAEKAKYTRVIQDMGLQRE